MAISSLQVGRGLRHLAQHALASTSVGTSSTSTGISASSSAARGSIRCFASSTSSLAAKAKPVAAKKKSTVKKKAPSGPRGAGGKKKGGADSSSSLSRTSEFHKDKADMTGMPVLSSDIVTKAVIGQTMAWNDKALTAFKHFGLPRELQRELQSQPRPRTLVREQTLQMLDRLDAAAQKKPAQKMLLTGPQGCGKSTLLAQSVSYALDKGWAVVYVPQAIDLINSSTTYVYSPTQLTYLQPEVTRTMIGAISQVNHTAFKNITTAEAVQLERAGTIEAGTTLEAVARQGMDESLNAGARHQVFELLLKTLVKQTKVPVLVALDDAQALFRTSLYRDPDYKMLEAYELAVPRTLLALISGQDRAFQSYRLVFVGATSSTHTEFLTPPELLVALQETAGADKIAALGQVAHAYTRLHEKHLANAQAASLEAVDVSQPLNRTEAAAIFAQLKQERKMWSPANDELFITKFVESAGNPRRFSRSLTSTLL